MKRWTLNSILVLLISTVIFSVTSCSTDDLLEAFGINESAHDTASNIAVIISPTANEPKPDLMLSCDEILNSCKSYAYKSLIIDDGAAYVAEISDLSRTDRIGGLSEQNKKLEAQAYAEEFIMHSDKYKALSPEKDTAKALTLAANSLSGCVGDKTIVLIDNGLSTKGIVAFTSLRHFDVEKSLAGFDNNNDLPDLKNFNVVWYGLGSTVAPQDELSNEDLSRLEEFWRGWLTKAGAASVSFPHNVTVTSDSDNSSLPWVSTVEVSLTSSKIVNYKDLVTNVIVEQPDSDVVNHTFDDALTQGIKLEETSVRFRPDSYELVDRESTVKLMKPFAEYLANRPDKKVVIIGTTATAGTQESCVNFSKGRAETIKIIFTEDMNIEADRLITCGLGYQNILHVPDVAPDGSLDESKAPLNRAVFLIDEQTAREKRYI